MIEIKFKLVDEHSHTVWSEVLSTSSVSYERLTADIKSMSDLTTGDVITVECYAKGHYCYESVIIAQKDALVESEAKKCDHILTEYRFNERERNHPSSFKKEDTWSFIKKYDYFQVAVEGKEL